MDLFTEENLNNLLDKKTLPTSQKDTESTSLRCMRKKYKCIMLWLLSIIAITQFLIIIFEKIDEKYINAFIDKFSKFVKSTQEKNSTLAYVDRHLRK